MTLERLRDEKARERHGGIPNRAMGRLFRPDRHGSPQEHRTISLPRLRESFWPMRGRHRLRDMWVSEVKAQPGPGLLARLAVIAGASGTLSAIPFSSALQSVLLMVLLIAGVGSAVLCWSDLPRGAAVAGVIGLSISAVIALATLMVWLQIWYPVPSCLVLALVVASSGLIRLWTLQETGGNAGPMSQIAAKAASDADGVTGPIAHPHGLAGAMGTVSRNTAPALLLAAFTIWLLALPLLRNSHVGQYGLLATSGGLLLVGAMILAVTGFFAAIATRQMVTAGVAVLATVCIERATVALITEVPNYVWTYRHIGLADYIMKTGVLPSLAFDIYSSWPGFFTCVAWFSSITRLDLVDAALWFAPEAATLVVVMVGALALGLGLTLSGAFTAAMVALILNWVGQDYFSPQGVAIILATAVLALLAHSKHHPVAGYVSLPIFAVLVTVHQLTPVWICAAVVTLALFAQMRPRWLAAPYLLILGVYLYSRRSIIDQYGWLSGFNPLSNSETVVNNRGSDGRVFTIFVEQAAALSMWLLAAVCFVVVWRGSSARLTAGIMAFSPMLLLFVQSYGGEAIFRVYLYTLPGSAVLLAAFLTRPLVIEFRGRRMRLIVAAWLTVIGFAVAAMQGYYGSWTYVTITRNQLEQSRWLSATTPADTLMIVPAPAGWPTRTNADYVRHAAVDPWYDNLPDQFEDPLRTGRPTSDALEWLETDARSHGNRRVYIVLTRQAWDYDAFMRYFTPGALQDLVERLNQRPGWERVINDSDTLAYMYSG
jgi:hypothetical protein